MRVVKMFGHKAIEAYCGTMNKYIMVSGPEVVELRDTEPRIGPQSYLVVKQAKDRSYYKGQKLLFPVYWV